MQVAAYRCIMYTSVGGCVLHMYRTFAFARAGERGATVVLGRRVCVRARSNHFSFRSSAAAAVHNILYISVPRALLSFG